MIQDQTQIKKKQKLETMRKCLNQPCHDSDNTDMLERKADGVKKMKAPEKSLHQCRLIQPQHPSKSISLSITS